MWRPTGRSDKTIFRLYCALFEADRKKVGRGDLEAMLRRYVCMAPRFHKHTGLAIVYCGWLYLEVALIEVTCDNASTLWVSEVDCILLARRLSLTSSRNPSVLFPFLRLHVPHPHRSCFPCGIWHWFRSGRVQTLQVPTLRNADESRSRAADGLKRNSLTVWLLCGEGKISRALTQDWRSIDYLRPRDVPRSALVPVSSLQ